MLLCHLTTLLPPISQFFPDTVRNFAVDGYFVLDVISVSVAYNCRYVAVGTIIFVTFIINILKTLLHFMTDLLSLYNSRIGV